jgi:hypothetical protein
LVLRSNLNDFFLYCPNTGLDGKNIRNPSLFPIDYRMVFWFILKLITCLKKIASFFNRLFFPVSFLVLLKTHLVREKFGSSPDSGKKKKKRGKKASSEIIQKRERERERERKACPILPKSS